MAHYRLLILKTNVQKILESGSSSSSACNALNFSSRILRSEALVYTIHIFFRTAALRKLFDFRFLYKHCNVLRVCLLVT